MLRTIANWCAGAPYVVFSDPRANEMQMKYELDSPEKSPGLLRKLLAFIVTVAMLGLVLMFSAVLLTIIMIAGMLAWTYLWWKTRELRKQMRDFSPRTVEREIKVNGDEVFEGEVIRVVDSRDGR
jgi:Flp pilus assembly protein TadB